MDPQNIGLIDAEASSDYLSIVIQPMGDKDTYLVMNVYDLQIMDDKLRLLNYLEKLRDKHARIL